MADLFPNLHLPKVDFSGIAEIPGLIQGAADEGAVKASLADLDASDPKSLREAANRAIATGTTKGIEAGMRLHAAAQARENLAQKSAADAAMTEWQSKYLPILLQQRGLAGAPVPENTGDVSVVPTAPSPSGGAVPGVQRPPVAFPPPPSMPGPQGALPMPPVAEAPSPSNQMIAAAQGAMPPAPGPQLAGPPPAPEAPPPPPLSPETVQGAMARPVVAPPPAAGPSAASVAAAPVTQSQAEGRATQLNVGGTIMTMPPKSAGMPAFRMFMEDYRNALAKQKLSPEAEAYQLDRVQSIRAGLGDISHSDWKQNLATNPDRYKATTKIFEDVQATGTKAQDMLGTITRLNQLINDKDFVSGARAESFAKIVSGMASFAKIAGINMSMAPEALRDKLSKIVDPQLRAAALVDEYKSLTNAAVLANAGSLSKGFSEGDRQFTERIWASIASNPQAIPAILDNLKQIAQRHSDIARVSREYMKETQSGAKSTPWGLAERMQEYNDAHPLFVKPNGEPTAAGVQVDQALSGPAPVAPRRVIRGPGGQMFNSEQEAWDAYRKGQL